MHHEDIPSLVDDEYSGGHGLFTTKSRKAMNRKDDFLPGAGTGNGIADNPEHHACPPVFRGGRTGGGIVLPGADKKTGQYLLIGS